MALKKYEMVSLKLDPEQKQQLRELAAADNRTISGYIKNMICREYEKQKTGK